ncbi:calcium sensing receptor, chloroplastic isoform X2 [Rhodamnia argentea]|uniref:Calcium sensing receptor, chloroplastic isoform X2 n=1 Tax=Rhodamnia argentea TaxID=178133 RepID=A0A8B8NZA3_9MYRT|nr:calcium sensing receptor, chloroplastic isoform X2 [Rhodamnia argentea]XP_030527895.1 calcium sensing receptor, chloroplastic isoform X2 [Rhodamnia argentea]XP_030527896.1 calcium sensing receptor, chloroplastic isoform X2 [Rhodamnia argentea]
MSTLPVCSATPSCSLHSQNSLNGGLQSLNLFHKDFNHGCFLRDKVFPASLDGKSLQRHACRTQATQLSYVDIDNGVGKSVWSSSIATTREPYEGESWHLRFVESSELPSIQEGGIEFTDQPAENASTVLESMDVGKVSFPDVAPDIAVSVDEPLSLSTNSIGGVKSSAEDIFSKVTDSINELVNKGESTLRSSLDSIYSSVGTAIKGANDAIDNASTKVFTNANQMGEAAGDRYTNITSDLKVAATKAAIAGVDVLRQTIVVLEDSLTKGASFIVYSYSSAKQSLPPDFRDRLNFSEEKTMEILKPVGVAFQQVYMAIEELERSLGLDPNDPIVPFALFLGTASTFWAFYWAWTYSGYSGDLSPNSTLELLMGKDGAVLIDVRPEVLRETDGIPDLRRAARFRYSSVSPPGIDGSLRKLLKGGRNVEDSLAAVVIRNLKIVQDRSKVIILDADGSRAKGIARSLRKLGIQKSYLVQGGFQSWVKQGLRIKELKPETTLTVLNEEAEAILEEINPSPLQLFASGVGLLAALYALVEWEKTLQFIGVVGLGQTIYRRLASYGGSEDLKQDLRLLAAPVKVGAEAFAWAAGKLETNGLGLPTSPSSSDVQNRVLQAAARHESQPSDDPEIESLPAESLSPGGESADLSEA